MKQYINMLEPIKEIINPRTSFAFKRMRTLGRINYFKWQDFDSNWHSQLANIEGPGRNSAFTLSATGENIVNELRTNAFSPNIALTPSALAAILEYCDASEFAPRKRPQSRCQINHRDPLNPSSESIYSIFNPHQTCTPIADIAHHACIRGIANAYLGCNAQLMGSQIWYTFPDTSTEVNPDFGFHYDIDDYRFLKIFFYLSNVNADCGPHQIISGSHRDAPIFRFFNRRITDETAEVMFENRIVSMEFSEGKGFFEDTFCYHKGTAANQPRLILQIQFSSSSGR